MIIANKYQATGNMKAGGMSEAHECQDIRLNRKVILKTLRRKEEQHRLADEKKALLKLRSNHVVQLLDIVAVSDAGQDLPCLVLEFIDGEDLEEGIFTIGDEYVQVLWQIAKGIEAIHNAQLVHRDLKPNNIRRDKEGVVKIIDFGLSREVGVDNHTHSAIGYLPYMAPELLVKGKKDFSYEADIFAFATVALAISKKGLPEWSQKRDTPNPPDGMCADHLLGLDPVVQQTLQKCLSLSPTDRPSISSVISALERPLLKNRHRARVVIGGKVHEIDSVNPTRTPQISSGGNVIAQLQIHYDGYEFLVKNVLGNVLSNNMPLSIGSKLPMSCVLAFQTKPGNFFYATFDVSNPEFMI